MRNYRLCFYVILVIFMITGIWGCGDEKSDSKETTKALEGNIKTLDEGAKITTFPLTIVISDKLSGRNMPENMQRLCALSKYNCKTLPISGILRLGSNNYYEFNCVSNLSAPNSLKNNEAELTDTIERQVNSYLANTRLNNYDSLLSPNREEWDMQSLSLEYIRSSADSIFFFSETAANSGSIRVGNKTFLVYNNVAELRKKIDQIICDGQRTISVFYTPPPFDSTQVTFTKSKWPAKGIAAGDTCIGYSRYEKVHDGSGGFMTGNLLELQSKSCGFKFPTGLAGDTCVKGSRYQKLHNGKGGFTVGNVIERNSKSCGFVYPPGPAGDTCLNGSRYQKLYDGKGGFTVGSLKERNSKSCGFTYPTGIAGDTCIKGSKYQKLHNGKGGFTVGNLVERNSKSCGFAYPTGVAGDTCVNGSRYQKLHDGKGGFSVGTIKERNSKSCGFVYPTGIAGDTCIKGSKYQKLHNGKGGFTVGNVIERNSKSCGFVYPTGIAGDTCIKGSKYQKLHNGKGGFTVGSLTEANSKSCGFVYPTGPAAGDTCINGARYQKLNDGKGGFKAGYLKERNSTKCGFAFPAAGTAATGYLCDKGSKYAKMNDGKGGFVRGALIETNSKQCAVTAPAADDETPAVIKGGDNICASRSDNVCEKDNAGNYTGRRVQYCYNKSGKVIRTILIAKCDGDCRCLGN